jgi:serine/threonine protein kinase
MENFTIYETLYESLNSTIVKCKNKNTKFTSVLKFIHQKKADSPSKEVLRELLILMNFKHKNLISLDSVFVHKSSVVFEMEYCVTSLNNIIKTISKPFHSAQIKKIIKSIAEGLQYLHENDIMHRDIKPANILITDMGVVKIGDFGSSRIYSAEGANSQVMTAQVGTKWYKAPELILGKKDYGPSVDIWSLGCLMAEILLLEPLFPGSTDFEMLNYIFSFFGCSEDDNSLFENKTQNIFSDMQKYDEGTVIEKLYVTFDCADNEAINLLSKMLVVNYEKRIKIEDVLNHPFLSNADKYKDVNLPI